MRGDHVDFAWGLCHDGYLIKKDELSGGRSEGESE